MLGRLFKSKKSKNEALSDLSKVPNAERPQNKFKHYLCKLRYVFGNINFHSILPDKHLLLIFFNIFPKYRKYGHKLMCGIGQ